MSRRRRWALFGGSFDPVHYGHLLVAERLREAERLDRVFFVPAARAPHKRRVGTSPTDRLAMLRLAVRGNPAFGISDLEIVRGGESYSIDTVREFAARWGQRPTFFLGGDALLELATWREPRALLAEARLVVVERPGAEAAAGRARSLGLSYYPGVLSATSSTALRERVRRGLSIRYQVPEPVRLYIERHGLYRAARAKRRS